MPNHNIAAFAKKIGARTPRTTTFKSLSGREFVLRDLNGAEIIAVDSLTNFKEFNQYTIFCKRAFASIVSVDGTPAPMLSTAEDFHEFLCLFDGTDIDEVVGAYQREFAPRGEELKNESGATSDSPSSPTPSLPESRTRKRSSSPTPT